MIVELYAAPEANSGQPAESPVSNPGGELPGQEPSLSPDQLLGSFDSRDEAVAFVEQQAADEGQEVSNTQSGVFNAYTHVEWLTVSTVQNGKPFTKTYYLVTDEGY